MVTAMILWAGEPRIKECIMSIVDHVDEIHIGVTTPIVPRYKWLGKLATMHKVKWDDHYAKARNRLIDAVGPKPWYYWIDPDEVLISSQHIINDDVDEECDVYAVKYIAPCRALHNNDGMVSEDWGTRLFKGNKGYKFSNSVHEVIDIDAKHKGAKFGKLEHVKVFHHGYAVSEYAMNKKNERYVQLLAKELKNSPGNPQMWKYMGTALLSLRRLNESVDAFAMYCQLSDDAKGVKYVKSIIKNIKDGKYEV